MTVCCCILKVSSALPCFVSRWHLQFGLLGKLLPVPYVQQVLQYSVLHTSILLGSLEKIFCVLNSLQTEIVGRFCSEGIPDGLSYDMSCRRGVMNSTKSTSIEVSVGGEDSLIGHKAGCFKVVVIC